MRRLLEASVCLLILGAFSTAFFSWAAFRRLDLFDMSAFLDAGYRVSIGQRPYLDFYFQAGPVHLWMLGLSFLLFGFGKLGVLAALVLTILPVGMSAYFLSRPVFSWPFTMVLVLLCALVFGGPYSHPWYDLTAAAFAIPAFVIAHPEFRLRGAGIATLVGVLCALSFLTKANVGLAAFGCSGLLVVCSGRPKNLLSFSAGFILGSLLLPMVYSLPAMVDQNFLTYGVSKRFTLVDRLGETLRATPYLWVFLVQCFVGCIGWKRDVRDTLLNEMIFGSCIAAIALFSAWTGSTIIEAHQSFTGIQVISLLRTWRLAPPKAFPRISFVLVGAAATFAFFSGIFATKHVLAWNWKESSLHVDTVLSSPGFEGWHCASSVCSGVDETVRYMKESIPAGDPVLVIPQSTILYGMSHRPSYPGMPFIFHVGIHPAPGEAREAVRERLLGDPPPWIIVDNQQEVDLSNPQETFRWIGIEDLVRDRYREAARFGTFIVLRRL